MMESCQPKRNLVSLLLWCAVAVVACYCRGPAFLQNLERPVSLPDFFQEYASARNVLEGLPVYADHSLSIPRYLGKPMSPGENVLLNAHPPASVLLGLPFAGLDFPDAFFVWNLLSLDALIVCLWLVKRELKVPVSARSICPAITAALLCDPLWAQVHHAQLNLILALLLTGVWAAERSCRLKLAGTLLGTATAIKLFPGFLLVYYIWRRQWSLVLTGLVTLLALTAITLGMFGSETHRCYVFEVLP